MTDGTHDGWNEWSKHVLKEMERFSEVSEGTAKDLHIIMAKLDTYSPENLARLQMLVERLVSSMEDQEARVRGLEQKEAAVGVLANQVTVRSDQIAQLFAKMDALEKHSNELRQTQAKRAAQWSVLGVIGSAAVAGLIGLAFSKAKEAPKTEHNAQPVPPIVHRLTEKDIERLRYGK